MVDQGATHVVHFDFDTSIHLFKVEHHLAAVGVWDDVEISFDFGVLFNVVEGADKPVVSGGLATIAFGSCGKPDGVGDVVEDIHLASLAFRGGGHVRLENPFYIRVIYPFFIKFFDESPIDRRCPLGTACFPEIEIVSVDLEFCGMLI